MRNAAVALGQIFTAVPRRFLDRRSRIAYILRAVLPGGRTVDVQKNADEKTRAAEMVDRMA